MIRASLLSLILLALLIHGPAAYAHESRPGVVEFETVLARSKSLKQLRENLYKTVRVEERKVVQLRIELSRFERSSAPKTQQERDDFEEERLRMKAKIKEAHALFKQKRIECSVKFYKRSLFRVDRLLSFLSACGDCRIIYLSLSSRFKTTDQYWVDGSAIIPAEEKSLPKKSMDLTQKVIEMLDRGKEIPELH